LRVGITVGEILEEKYLNWSMKKKRIWANQNPDIEKYIIVHSKEGDYIRAKRKSPFINDQLAMMAAETCSGAAKQILTKLKPFTEQMTGRMNVRLSGKMRSAKKQTGSYNYSLLKEFDLQKDHPLYSLYQGVYQVSHQNGKITLAVPISTGDVLLHNKIVTAYYFEAVLLTGDAMVPNSLRIEDDRSDLFYFNQRYDTVVVFQFIVPENMPFLLFLKVGCMEGEEAAYHPRHYGMKVVEVG
jgi:hypothetical protein